MIRKKSKTPMKTALTLTVGVAFVGGVVTMLSGCTKWMNGEMMNEAN